MLNWHPLPIVTSGLELDLPSMTLSGISSRKMNRCHNSPHTSALEASSSTCQKKAAEIPECCCYGFGAQGSSGRIVEGSSNGACFSWWPFHLWTYHWALKSTAFITAPDLSVSTKVTEQTYSCRQDHEIRNIVGFILWGQPWESIDRTFKKWENLITSTTLTSINLQSK